MPTLLSQPSLSGTMPNAFPQYSNLANGFTDRIFLLGHGPDSMPLNDPYHVIDIREAVKVLGADHTCPLLRGLMELYYGGARDIFLMSAAPMSDFEPDIMVRDAAWYQNYSDQLQVAYDILLDWDLAQIVVPLNAPYYDARGVDFLTPLADHCARAFDQAGSNNNSPNTGSIRIGLLGTSFITMDNRVYAATALYPSPGLFPDALFVPKEVVETMHYDNRLAALGADGKFVAVIVGEGVVNIPEMDMPYMASLATSCAAELCQLPYNRSLTYTRLRNTMSLRTRFTKPDIDAMSEKKLNVVDLTTLGHRNQSYQSVILTDNTLGEMGTDFWSLVQVRLSMHIIDTVRALGRRYMGSIGFGQYKQDVQNFLVGLMKANYVKEINCNVNRDQFDPTAIKVDITFTPYFGIRQITFSINVGPAN